MTHPTIARAYELLENREQQQAEHELWRERHSDELERWGLDQLVTKAQNNGFDPEASLQDQQFQARAYATPPTQTVASPGDAIVTAKALEEILGVCGDEIFALIGGDLKKLRSEIAPLRDKVRKLETEVAVLRGMKSGKVSALSGKVRRNGA